MGRTYRNYTKEVLNTKLHNFDTTPILNETNPELAWEMLYHKLIAIADEMCPVREYTIKTKHHDWLTPEIIEIQKDRDYFFKKARKSNNDSDWFIAKNLRNLANTAVRKAKAEYIKSELERYKTDPKIFWRSIKTHVLSDNKGGNINLKDENGEKLSKQQTVDSINEYFFADIGLNLARKIPQGPTTLHQDKQTPRVIINLQPVTKDQVMKRLSALVSHKSSGLMDISTTFLKDSLMSLGKAFTHIINQVLMTGIVPDSWKIANVVPVPKTNNARHPDELRPISLLPVMGKIMEQLVHEQLMKHLEKENKLDPMQFGFRKKKSTSVAGARLLDEIQLGLEKKETVIIGHEPGPQILEIGTISGEEGS